MFILPHLTDMGGADSKENFKDPSPVVETQYGPVEGFKTTIPDGRSINVFLGIPFAKPPIGRLRFSKPEPPDPWEVPLSCKKYKDISVQYQFFFQNFKTKSSENCLFLNIVVPDWPRDAGNGLFPVMVYIHGGGFLMDSAVNYNYKKLGKNLAKNGVIIVTIPYRLGFLGYFCTDDETAPGNYGLWDQVFGIKFISENISKFGGDPENITVFGQSAGGVSADLLSIIPMTRTLIKKTATLGGNCEAIWGVFSKSFVAENCRNLAKRLGFKKKSPDPKFTKEDNEEMLEYLRKLPSSKFEMTMLWAVSIFKNMRLPLGPIVDGDILPEPPYVLRAQAPPRPILAGNCAHEGLIFLALGLRTVNNSLMNEMKQKFIKMNELIKRAYGSDDVIPVEEIMKAYGVTETLEKNKNLQKQAIVEMMDDCVNNFGLYNYAQAEMEKGSNVWMYFFEHHNPKITAGLKFFLPFSAATHATELAYLMDVNLFLMPYKKTSDDLKVVDIFTTIFTNFAKYGNPNGDPTNKILEFNWDPISKERPENYLKILPKPIQVEKLETRIGQLSKFYGKLNRYFCDQKFEGFH